MKQLNLEIDLLRAFIAVTETGSFTAAGPRIYRSQSAVSQKISRLESILGQPLFERDHRQLQLSHAGEKLMSSARQMIDLNDRIIYQFTTPNTVGRIRLGIAEDFIRLKLPAILGRFRRIYPHIHIELQTGLSCDLHDRYDQGLLDLILVSRPRQPAGGMVIWQEPLVWLASKDFIFDEQQALPLVLLPAPCQYRELMLSELNATHREWEPSCIASNLMAIQEAVAGGLGVTVLGRSFLQHEMQILPTGEHWPELPQVEMVAISETQNSNPLIKPLIAFIQEALNQQAHL